ncbi:hypothetical protein LZD49_03295 [Dyadobacter sp. CY261]|uniref:hypothetical protein n=1 Tax=Dyadobacter sp. CY261 TaxID=2907203 RepID=UPI001F20E360|nr:hypothetical protein [Dyadobacter sp. CY261]MCF0069480.1 hypothetical protein [Dyadobacter sp. CY261]
MKNFFRSIAVLGLSFTLFNCSNTEEPLPAENPYASEVVGGQANAREGSSNGGSVIQSPTKFTAWRLAKTLTVQQEKGFNLISPFAITAAGAGDIGWGAYGCYSALKPVKVSFHNLGIVDVASLKPSSLDALPFNQAPIANAPEGSAFWTNYMPAKTIIACKTPAGKHYLVEVLSDNPLQVNIYHAVRLLGQ